MSLTKKRPADFSEHPTNTPTVVCDAALILPAQVPLRDVEPGNLFCVSCGKLVAVEPARMAKAIEAARAEGFEAKDVPEVQTLPGTLPRAVRAGLYWAHKTRGLKLNEFPSAAVEALDKARAQMEELGLYKDGRLTEAGASLAANIAEPPVDARLRRTDDPALAEAQPAKKRSRNACIDSLVPRCANRACYKPLPRDGACSCGNVEGSPARLAEIRRCWDIVDEKAPVKPKRARAPKAEATP